MSAAGSRLLERMLTVCESLGTQGRSILDSLEESSRAGPLRRASTVAPPSPRAVTPYGT